MPSEVNYLGCLKADMLADLHNLAKKKAGKAAA